MKLRTVILGVVCLSSSVAFAQLKSIGQVKYYQLPTKGIKYEKVNAYVTFDQSDTREMADKAGGMMGGAAGALMSNTAKVLIKDITEVYDTWSLVPDYIKADNGKGALRLDVTYKPDDLRRPMTAPPVNQQRGGHVVPYKVFASMKLTDPTGKVIMERNYGELSGDFVSATYVTAAESEEGIGTYEMACIRAAMLKARAEVFGLYGFGQMKATLDLGPIKEIKASAKPTAAVIKMLQSKKGYVLSESEKAMMKEFVDVIEKDINLASDKTRWAAYHDLAIGYAWLLDEKKAKEYLAKEFQESKESIELVRNFGKKGSKGYNGKDLAKFQAYGSIEEFVNYYPAAATMYPDFIRAIQRPFKQFTDFYTYNDLLCQIYGLDIFYQFLPFDSFKGDVKSVKGSIKQEGKPDINYSLSLDKAGNPKGLEIESVDGEGEKLKTKEIQPIYNTDGDYTTTRVSGFESLLGPSKYDLRHMSAPDAEETKGEAGKVLKADGIFSETSAKNQMLIDLKGVIYFSGSNKYSTPNAFYSKFLKGSDTKFGKAKSTTKCTAEFKLNDKGEMIDWKWDGTAHMGWGFTAASNGAWDNSMEKNTVDGTINRKFKASAFDANGLPSSITVDSKTNAKLKTKEIDWKKVKSQYESYSSFWASAGKPKVNATASGFDGSSSEEWPSAYTVDAKGNWTEAKVGPYIITRVFK